MRYSYESYEQAVNRSKRPRRLLRNLFGWAFAAFAAWVLAVYIIMKVVGI